MRILEGDRRRADLHAATVDVGAPVGAADQHRQRPLQYAGIAPVRLHRGQRRAAGSAVADRRRQQPRMVDFHRRAAGVGDDHRGAGEAGDLVELPGERHRQADAAVGGGIAGQPAGMQGDAVPGQALHVGHGGVVVQVGAVLDLLLQDGEHAGRGFLALLAGADRGDADGDAVAVDEDALLAEAYHQRDRALGGDFRVPEELPGLQRSHGMGQIAQGRRFVRRGNDQAGGQSECQCGQQSLHRHLPAVPGCQGSLTAKGVAANRGLQERAMPAKGTGRVASWRQNGGREKPRPPYARGQSCRSGPCPRNSGAGDVARMARPNVAVDNAGALCTLRKATEPAEAAVSRERRSPRQSGTGIARVRGRGPGAGCPCSPGAGASPCSGSGRTCA
ncbi:hypothetical protein D3C76_480880 [compost metagenome]